MNVIPHSTREFKEVQAKNQEIEYYDQLHAEKCRDPDQTFKQHCEHLANKLATDEFHYQEICEAVYLHRFLPAGRIQAALGASLREVSPFNCSVSQKIEDSMTSIMGALGNAAKILRLGTGIGYNFSHLRPKGALIEKLQTQSSGPLSFMEIYDVMAKTIASSGHRRGAQMGILNISHPDIEAFIDAKMEPGKYRQFNLSVGVSDAFMEAVYKDQLWNLEFKGTVYKTLSAKYLWEKIITNAYYSAEPGVIFIDRLNQNNNLYYCEHMEATNPCAEQPLPPYGLCTLGSFNLIGYIQSLNGVPFFDFDAFRKDIHTFVEAYDNIFDNAIYAIPEHKVEALNKRRIGLGFTGIANAIELLLGKPCYGEKDFCSALEEILTVFRDTAYQASIDLARTRGPFPLYRQAYLGSEYIQTLPQHLKDDISRYGIRNSHIISFAPCGTISQYAWNVSSGVEPVFHYEVDRDVYMKDGLKNVTLKDFNVRHYNFYGKTLEDCTVDDHLRVAEVIQKYTDSAISKTVNVASNCQYNEYEKIYWRAFGMGLKGITVYRPNEIRGAVIVKSVKVEKPKVENFPEVFGSCTNGICTL